MQFDRDAWFAHEIPEMRRKGHVSPIGDFIGETAVGQDVANSARRDRASELDGRFQQGTSEREHLCPIRTRAFREKHHWCPRREERLELNRDFTHLSSPFAIDEDRGAPPGVASKNRPVRDLLLRNKSATCDRAERDNIEIADVIGYNEAVAWDFSKHMDLQIEPMSMGIGDALQPSESTPNVPTPYREPVTGSETQGNRRVDCRPENRARS